MRRALVERTCAITATASALSGTPRRATAPLQAKREHLHGHHPAGEGEPDVRHHVVLKSTRRRPRLRRVSLPSPSVWDTLPAIVFATRHAGGNILSGAGRRQVLCGMTVDE